MPDPTVQRRFYTPSEVAEILGVAPNTVRDMARRADLPAIKIRSKWRFPIEAIDELTARAQEGPEPPARRTA